jgi:hypothetical protein
VLRLSRRDETDLATVIEVTAVALDAGCAAGSPQRHPGRSSPPAENALSEFMASRIPDRRSV